MTDDHPGPPDAAVTDAAAEAGARARLRQEIAHRVAVEHQLRESAERFQAVWNASLDAMVLSDPDGIVQLVNPAYATLYGYAPADLVGHSFSVIFPEEERAWALAGYLAFFQGPERTFQAEATVQDGQGRERIVESFASFLYEGEQRVAMLSVIRDITERRQAEAALRAAKSALEERVVARTQELQAANTQLRDLARQIITAQEVERQRVARELHDRLGQNLTVLTLRIKALADAPVPAVPSQLAELLHMTSELMQTVQQLAWELRPSELDDWGLPIALQHYSTEWTRRSGVPVDYVSLGPEQPRLDHAVETALYRLVQEALTNVLRHAGASRVSLLLEHDPASVRVVVEDNGRGFDWAALQDGEARQRLGVAGMQERVALVNGTLEIESAPGRGTTLFVWVPLAVTPPGDSG